MFDIGFTEVTLIAVIGLLVIGPERLPRVAREIGLWVGRLRRYVAQVRADIEREVRADELRELVKKPAEELKEAIKETEKTIKETEKTIKDEEKKLESDLKDSEGTKSISGADTTARGEATEKTPKSRQAATRGANSSEADPAAGAAPEKASVATEQKEDEVEATALGEVAAPAANSSGTASVAPENGADAAMERDEENAGERAAPAPTEDVGARDAKSASESEKAGAPAREAS